MKSSLDRVRTLAEGIAELINCAAYFLLRSEDLSAEQLVQFEGVARRVTEALPSAAAIQGPRDVDFDRLLEVLNAMPKSLTNSSRAELNEVCRGILDSFHIQLPDALPSTE